MIDLATETLIPISEVPKRLPRRPSGKTVHISAVYRWITKGILQGGQHVRLESAHIGGSHFTSVQAIQRFSEALTGNRQDSPTPLSRMSRTRQTQARQAAQQVRERLGIRSSPADSTSSNSPTNSRAHHAPDGAGDSNA